MICDWCFRFLGLLEIPYHFDKNCSTRFLEHFVHCYSCVESPIISSWGQCDKAGRFWIDWSNLVGDSSTILVLYLLIMWVFREWWNEWEWVNTLGSRIVWCNFAFGFTPSVIGLYIFGGVAEGMLSLFSIFWQSDGYGFCYYYSLLLGNMILFLLGELKIEKYFEVVFDYVVFMENWVAQLLLFEEFW